MELAGSTKEERAEGLSSLKDRALGMGGQVLYFLYEQSKWKAKD